MSPIKRPGTNADRDTFTTKTPPKGVALQIAAPVQVDDEVTGKHDGDELARLRAQRPTDQRIARLEDKHDKLDDKVDGIDSRTSRMEGKLDTALAFITDHGKTQRTKISTNGKIIIAIACAAITTIGTVLVAVLT